MAIDPVQPTSVTRSLRRESCIITPGPGSAHSSTPSIHLPCPQLPTRTTQSWHNGHQKPGLSGRERDAAHSVAISATAASCCWCAAPRKPRAAPGAEQPAWTHLLEVLQWHPGRWDSSPMCCPAPTPVPAQLLAVSVRAAQLQRQQEAGCGADGAGEACVLRPSPAPAMREQSSTGHSLPSPGSRQQPAGQTGSMGGL